MKKVIALLFALILVFAISTVVFAEARPLPMEAKDGLYKSPAFETQMKPGSPPVRNFKNSDVEFYFYTK